MKDLQRYNVAVIHSHGDNFTLQDKVINKSLTELNTYSAATASLMGSHSTLISKLTVGESFVIKPHEMLVTRIKDVEIPKTYTSTIALVATIKHTREDGSDLTPMNYREAIAKRLQDLDGHEIIVACGLDDTIEDDHYGTKG